MNREWHKVGSDEQQANRHKNRAANRTRLALRFPFLAVCSMLLASHTLLLVAYSSLFNVYCPLAADCFSLHRSGFWLLPVCCSILMSFSLLFVTHYFLQFAVRCSLLGSCCLYSLLTRPLTAHLRFLLVADNGTLFAYCFSLLCYQLLPSLFLPLAH